MYNFRLVQQPLLRTLFVRDIFSLDRNSKKKQAPLAVTCFLINK